MNKTLSPPSKPPRVSVPVSGEVLEIFERLAKAGNMSTGRAIAEWLSDTVEAAELMASTMERARSAPKLVTAELHAMALAMGEQTKGMMDRFSRLKASPASGGAPLVGRSREQEQPSMSQVPPSCNTGGKVPPRTKKANGPKPGFPLPPAKVQAYADTNGIPPKASK